MNGSAVAVAGQSGSLIKRIAFEDTSRGPALCVTEGLLGARDAFGRWRTSEPFTEFDSLQVQGGETLFWDIVTAGAGSSAHSAPRASTALDVTAASGDSVIRQTNRYFTYQPGKSRLVFMTFVMNAPETDLRQRVGYFDADNGLFLEQADTGDANINFVIRSSTSGAPVPRPFPKTAWNIDKLDGNGPSRVTLDLTKNQIFFVEFEWLGTGSVLFGFVINRRFIPCHQVDNSNVLDVVYMSTPTLPVRYEIENTGVTTGTSSLEAICCSVISEGGRDPRGATSWAANGVTVTAIVSSAFRPVVAVRLKAANIRAFVHAAAVRMLSVTNDDVEWNLVLNPATLTGGAWASLGTTSFVELNTTATALTGGTALDGDYINQSTGTKITTQARRDYLGATIGGVSDVMVLAARSRVASANVLGGLQLVEVG